MADTNVEWGLSGFSVNGQKNYVLTTSHDGDYVQTPTNYPNVFGYELKSQLFDIHSHVNDFGSNASGFKAGSNRAYGDRLYYYRKKTKLANFG